MGHFFLVAGEPHSLKRRIFQPEIVARLVYETFPQLLMNSSAWLYGYAAMPQTSQTIKMDGFNIKPSAKFLRLVDKNITFFMNSYPDIMVKGSQNLWS